MRYSAHTTRRKKLELVQLWQHQHCKRVFTPPPVELRNKTYPLRLILEGVTFYNLAFSLAQTVAKLKSPHGRRIPTTTLSSWINEHAEVTTYRRLRTQGKRKFIEQRTIRAVKLYHKQVIIFHITNRSSHYCATAMSIRNFCLSLIHI